MPEPPAAEAPVVSWDVQLNLDAGTIDFAFDVTPPVDALIDVQRFIPASALEIARRHGVPDEELEGPITVAENIPIKRGRGSWRDYFCDRRVTYQYRIRGHDFSDAATSARAPG